MCDENYQLSGSVPVYEQPTYVLTNNTGAGNWYGGSASAWTCAKCGYLVFAGSVHYCPTVTVSIPTVWTELQAERKPHVCPVCTGRGVVDRPVAADTGGETCPACKGACVLWG